MIPNYKDRLLWPVPTQSLERAPRLILEENSFQFNEKNYLQTHGTVMGTKVSVAFANIFKAKVETELYTFSNWPWLLKRWIALSTG